ncbi:MAG TPA: porin, partial [Longimicrobiales bacterium]|nr:porin [Longimicrobiales bacterium]
VTDNADDRLEWVGRLFAHPFRGGVPALEGLGVGVAASRGRAAGTATSTGLATYRTTGRATIFRYDPSAAASGDRTRVALQGYFYSGRAGLMGEWVRSTHEVAGSGGSGELSHSAWNVNASLALTDDRPAYGGLAPRSVLSLERGTLGALELAGRVQSFAFDEDAFVLGLADPTLSVRQAFAWTIGLNWYPHPNARVLVSFERTTFHGGAASGDRRAEGALFTRVQLGL